MMGSHVFWYLRISLRAIVPGLHLLIFCVVGGGGTGALRVHNGVSCRHFCWHSWTSIVGGSLLLGIVFPFLALGDWVFYKASSLSLCFFSFFSFSFYASITLLSFFNLSSSIYISSLVSFLFPLLSERAKTLSIILLIVFLLIGRYSLGSCVCISSFSISIPKTSSCRLQDFIVTIANHSKVFYIILCQLGQPFFFYK